MDIVGKVDSVWRYPVKSMRGEELGSAYIGYAGIYGDRMFAFTSTRKPAGFPWVTGREQREMLLYRPRYRHPAEMARPLNLAEAEKIGSGMTPQYANPEKGAVDVETPSGEVLAVDDPALVTRLSESLGGEHDVVLVRSDRAMTDCRPISLLSVQTARQLSDEVGSELDPRRFRANVYLDLGPSPGFAEDELVGSKLGIGSKAVVSVLQRDSRCKMICIDPDTAEENLEVLEAVSRAHDGKAGVYGAVLAEGLIRPGDPVQLMD